MVFKSRAPPAIRAMGHKDKEVICLYIDAWIRKQKFEKIFADSTAIIEFINQKIVHELHLRIY